MLMENKRLAFDIVGDRRLTPIEAGRPWRIGWFGNIRCKRSFELLFDLAQRRPDLLEVDIRGLPTRELQALIDQRLPLPNMTFGGRYRQSDLASMYGSCHLTWAIDYYEEGVNSSWLLPNRIYEGGYFGRPALAQAGTQTASWLEARSSGVIMNAPERDLESTLQTMGQDRYRGLLADVEHISLSDLVWTLEDCRRFVNAVTETGSGG
jgi:hypothetical protein